MLFVTIWVPNNKHEHQWHIGQHFPQVSLEAMLNCPVLITADGDELAFLNTCFTFPHRRMPRVLELTGDLARNIVLAMNDLDWNRIQRLQMR